MARVVIGYISDGNVRAEFMRSMLRTVSAPGTVVAGTIDRVSGPLLARARNEVVAQFLRQFRRQASWLFMVDTDMVFNPDAVARLLAAADPQLRPIMGGLCFTNDDSGPLPTLYELVEAGHGAEFARYRTWPENEVMRVAGTGAACMLVHQSVFERIAAGPKPDPAYPWFRESTMVGQRPMGEDLTFCLRAQSVGIPVHVHTGVQFGHIKTHMIGKVT
jgi:GT2 family glycosyltransferase